MKHIRSIKVILLLIGLSFSTMVKSQGITTGDILDSWDIMSKMVVESAKLMPADGYQFTPGEPLRNFANQINHTTKSNIGFAASVNAGKPTFAMPDRNNPPQDKEAVIALLENSFQYFRSGLEKLSTEDLKATVKWGHPNNPKQITRLKAILIVMSHLQREHGKTMMYLRAKGIQPAPAGSWSF